MARSTTKLATRLAARPLTFIGSSLDDLRDFPRDARREAGFQLDKVQNGENPDDWKAMSSVGSGAYEIRIRDDTGVFRIIYVAKFSEAVYVLHAFRKKSRKTAKKNIDLAVARYQEMTTERRRQ
ncbi:MAG: type II toxin-antitoxin system RelE/ParE family toxin [Steroidobacteraceae bacterium]